MGSLQGEQGTVSLISPDGKTRESFLQQDVNTMLGQGWTHGGDAVPLATPYGDRVVTPESTEILKSQGQDYNVIPASGERELYESDVNESKYGDRTGAALGLGALRGLTMGLSDAALVGLGFDKEAIREIKERNALASGVGEFGTILGTGVLGAGKGLVAKGLQKTPAGFASLKAIEYGEKGTAAFIAAGTAEGALWGMGQSVSQISLSNEPMAAETAAWEILKGGGAGALFGGVGSAAFKGMGSIATKVKASKLPKAPHFDIKTPEGDAFLGGVSQSMRNIEDVGNEILAKSYPKAYKGPDLAEQVGKLSDELKAAIKASDGIGDPVIAKRIGQLEDELMVEMQKAPAFDPNKGKGQFSSDLVNVEEPLSTVGADVFRSGSRASKISNELRILRKAAGPSKPVKGMRPVAEIEKDLAANIRLQAEAADLAQVPRSEGSKWAVSEYESALKDFKKVTSSSAGEVNKFTIGKAINGTPEEVMALFGATERYHLAVEDLAKVAGDKAAAEQVALVVADLNKHVAKSLPPEVIKAASHLKMDAIAGAAGVADALGVIPEGGPYDEIAKAAVLFSLLRHGKGAIGSAIKAGKAAKVAGDLLTAGGGGSAGALVSGPGWMQSGARQVARVSGRKVVRAGLGQFDSPQSLYQLSGRSNSGVKQAVQRMLSKSTKTMMGGGGAVAMLKALKFAEDSEDAAEKREDDLHALFMKKGESLRKLAGDPQRLAQDLYEATGDIRGTHPTFGDKVEVGLGSKYNYMYQKWPKDPGTMHMMGKSVWRPDDFAMQETANMVQGVVDPMSVVDGVKDGSITAAGARALRDNYPEIFSAIQAEIAMNTEAVIANLDYDEQNRLSILMGVPVNSVTEPEYVKFVIGAYTERQAQNAESMGKVDANALMQGTPTQAQTLLARGNKR